MRCLLMSEVPPRADVRTSSLQVLAVTFAGVPGGAQIACQLRK